MKPGVVIGAGGTGKWVATYVTKGAIDYHQRELLRQHGEAARQQPDWADLPTGIDVFAVDVSRVEQRPVELHDAFSSHFSLNYEVGSSQFVNVGQPYKQVVEAIQKGTGERDYPMIARWLRQEDAKCYDLDRLDPTTYDGAGQLRQLGRLSIFLALQASPDLVQRIQDALHKVAAARTGTDRVTIFLAGSVAGGTGSGGLIDLAALVHMIAPQILGDNYDVVGFVVLPNSFLHAAPGSNEKSRMQANSYAALRELMRFTAAPGDYEIPYTSALKAIVGQPLFSLLYLVEGSRPGGYDLQGAGTAEGTNPAIADAVLLHLSASVDYRQIKTEQMQHPQGAYSVMGSVLYIFPAEEMIWEFGHQLTQATLEALYWGRSLHTDVQRSDVLNHARVEGVRLRDEYFESQDAANPPMGRWIRNFMTSARKPQLSTPVLMSVLRLNDQDRDRPLPTLKLEDRVEVASMGSVGDPPAVKAEAEKYISTFIGTPDDDNERGNPSIWGVLNSYRKHHQEIFRRNLASTTLHRLNDGSGEAAKAHRAGILEASAALGEIAKYLNEFRGHFSDQYKEQQYLRGQRQTKLDRAREEAGRAETDMLRDEGRLRDMANNHGQQVTYIQRKQAEYDLTVQDLVASMIGTICDDLIAITGEYSSALNAWAASFRDHAAELDAQVQAIRNRRREAARIQVHHYLSEPDDNYERRLLGERAGATDVDNLSESEGVQELLGQMNWSWGNPADASSLIVHLPPIPGREADKRVVEWERDGVDVLLHSAFPRFASIRLLSIWDNLASGGPSVDELRRELELQAAPITAVNDQEQHKRPEIRTVDQRFFIAPWVEAQSTDQPGSPRKLSSDLREALGVAAISWDDPQRLLGVTLRHLVKLSAISSVNQLREPYQRLLSGQTVVEGTEGRVPLHLFHGEQLAAELEAYSLQVLGETVEIPVELVALLESEDELGRFARAIAFEQITREVDRSDGSQRWIFVSADDGQAGVTIGGTALEACNVFIRPGTPTEQQAKEAAWSRTRAAEDSSKDNAAYAEELRKRSNQRLIPEADRSDPPVREGLDRALRLLLRMHADKVAG